MANYDWKLMGKIRGGHSYWLDLASGRLAIADDSSDGKSPEYTDDGVCWVVEPIVVRYDHMLANCFWLPLETESGDPTVTSVGLEELVWLVEKRDASLWLTKNAILGKT